VFESLAQLLLMALAIALLIAYASKGTEGVGEWLKAKFVGNP
jgi:hypothetical protein